MTKSEGLFADPGPGGHLPHVAVVGLGLIGGSIAQALVQEGVQVSGYDPVAATRAAATAAGIAAASSIEELCAMMPDVVFLAVPLRAMRSTAQALSRHLGPTAVITDVGSVKAAVRQDMYAAGLRGRYVGAHPMFGTQFSGFAASDQAAPMGAAWALTIDEVAEPAQVLAVVGLITGPLGGHVFVLSDDVHDEVVALISHVPHVMATQLLALVAATPVRDVALGLAAGSFRDGTRVGRTDPRRTEAMITENAPWVASVLRVVIRDLAGLVEQLETNSSPADFFDRPDPVRGVGAWVPGQVSVVALVGRWRERLCAAGAAGSAVISVNMAAKTVTLAG